MSLQIGQAYQVFHGLNGMPLDNGKIYVGVAGKNPITDPIKIYYDESFTKTAANPATTTNGYVSQNGTPTNVYANVDKCSLSVYEKNGKLVFSDLYFSGLGDSSQKKIVAANVINADNRTQQTINDQVGATWYQKAGGYSKYSEVMLNNGIRVKSTIDNNVADPNSNLMNWSVVSDFYSLTDFGGYQGLNNTNALNLAKSKKNVLFNSINSIINQSILSDKLKIDGIDNSTIINDTKNQHILYCGYAAGSSDELLGVLIDGQYFDQLVFNSMPKADSDDFAAITFAQTQNAKCIFNRFDAVENATSSQCSPSKYGKSGEGSKDNFYFGNYIYKARRYVHQNLQSNYTKIIGITAQNDGDNSTVPSGETNNGGWNGGIRLAGLAKGNIVALNNIRDRYTSVDFQRGNLYNIVTGNYLENSFSNSINVSSTNLPMGGYHNISNQMIVNAGASGVRLNNLALTNGSASVHGAAVYGVDTYPAIDGDEFFIVWFESATGTVPTTGTTITQGTVTAVVHEVRNEALTVVASGSTMPTKGTILIKSVSGRLSKNTAFTEISATITNVKIAEGHNLGAYVVSQSQNQGVRIGTNGNNFQLEINASEDHPMIVTGGGNLLVVTISERVTGKYVQIVGSNNTVIINDNSKNTADVGLLVSGTNNIVIVNTKGRVSCSGSSNTIIAETSRLAVTGNNNKLIGRADAIANTGTGNDWSGFYKCNVSATVSLTTNSQGQVTINHGMLLAATSLNFSIVSSDTLLFATTANVAASSTTSIVQIWTASGVKAASGVSVSISYNAKI